VRRSRAVNIKMIEFLGYVRLSIHALKNTPTHLPKTMPAELVSQYGSQGYTSSVTKTNKTASQARHEAVDP
jgi:hypothetical protein